MSILLLIGRVSAAGVEVEPLHGDGLGPGLGHQSLTPEMHKAWSVRQQGWGSG